MFRVVKLAENKKFNTVFYVKFEICRSVGPIIKEQNVSLQKQLYEELNPLLLSSNVNTRGLKLLTKLIPLRLRLNVQVSRISF